ncbi:MAG TPA: glycogen/starch synthase, partial [Ramlibacter sp.]|nr:glycogen/starch synthase [Ramlibacter sp.]
MKILYACSELFPLLKTGGLGDVSGALPPALREAGCDVRVLLPGFPAIRAGVAASSLPRAVPLALPPGGPDVAHLLGAGPPPVLRQARLPGTGLAAYVLEAPALFDR